MDCLYLDDVDDDGDDNGFYEEDEDDGGDEDDDEEEDDDEDIETWQVSPIRYRASNLRPGLDFRY